MTGSFADQIMKAMMRKIPTMRRYGRRTTSVSECAECARERMRAEPKMGVTTAPTALKDWARFRRRSADDGGPRKVTYGFEETSRNDCPQAMIKSASRKNQYVPAAAAGMKRNAPVAQMSRPQTIPR